MLQIVEDPHPTSWFFFQRKKKSTPFVKCTKSLSTSPPYSRVQERLFLALLFEDYLEFCIKCILKF